MSYYRTCPACGANLDPGEVCDCLADTLQEARELFPDRFAGMTDKEVVKEIARVVNAALGAANTRDGKVDHVDHAVSTFNDTKETEELQV